MKEADDAMDLLTASVQETIKRIDSVMAREPMGITLKVYDTLKELDTELKAVLETIRPAEEN